MNKYSKKRAKKNNKPSPSIIRIRMIKYMFYCCMIVILAKAFQLQTLSDPSIKKKTKAIYHKKIVIEKKRGTIFDRNGEVLAMSIDAFDIAIRPQYLSPSIAGEIAGVLNINKQYTLNKIRSKYKFIYLKRRVEEQNAKKLKALIREKKLNPMAFDFKKATKRVYPNNTLAGALIGYTNRRMKSTGLEKKFNHMLKGDKLSVPIISAGRGNWYEENDSLENADHGNDIYLTIDSNIQHIAEDALEKGIELSGAKDAKAVVMDPNSGEILAMAQYPFFNPNNYWDCKEAYKRYNRNALDAFEPGSIMKVFLVAGALEKGYCKKNSIFYCNNGSYTIGPVTIHDTKPHKWLRVKDIVKYSSNIGATKIAEVMGKKSLYNTLVSFGFAQKTGIDLPIETKGVLRPSANWTDVDISNIAFGQGMAASTIQLAVAGSAIANNGYLLKPSIVKKIVSPDRSVIFRSKRTIREKIISEDTAVVVKNMMASVVSEGGTGANAILNGYSAGGKTGTSQKLEKNGKYSRDKFIASFLGMAPIENPKLVVIVMVNEPKNSHYGGTVAAPIFREIVSNSLKYLDVPPTDITIASK